ncbi:MAG: hypothetical protein P8013_14065 [Candidatus Sulfobium sp.]|jgi:peroxiredoxin (alkyl hydroperoxide reductase subunit C)
MQVDDESIKGPSLGDPAPFIEAIALKKTRKRDSGSGWTILISHPQDLLPLFKTRTINYVLCKRKIRIVMTGSGSSDNGASDNRFLTKYITRHNMAFLDDPDGRISSSYGLGEYGANGDVKGVFVIDPGGILRMKLYFDPGQPRNFYEILKLVDALQEADRQKRNKPASGAWKRRLSIISRPGTVPEEG